MEPVIWFNGTVGEILKMDGPHRSLLEILLSMRTATPASLGIALGKGDYKKCPSGATEMYDSYSMVNSKNCVLLSHMGRKVKVFIVSSDSDIDPDAVPGLEDLVLIVQNTGNAILIGGELINEAVRKELDMRISQVPETSDVGVIMRPYVYVPATIQQTRPVQDVLSSVFGASPPAGLRTRFFSEESRIFAEAIEKDKKRWAEAGVVMSDRPQTITVAESFRAADPTGYTLVLWGGTGELAFALHAAGITQIVNYEYHPIMAQMSESHGSKLGITTIVGNPMGPVMDAQNGVGPALPNVVAQFPFIQRSAYFEGAPAITADSCKCDAIHYPEELPTIETSHAPKPTENVGVAMLCMTIREMAPDSVGTFVVPESFGVSSVEKVSRYFIVSTSIIQSYTRTFGSRCILTLKKRKEAIMFGDAPEHQHKRTPEVSNPWVRWIGGSPVFVTDQTILGIDAGVVGKCKVLGDLLQDAVRYSSQQAYNAALKSAISEIPHGSEGGPSSTYVLLSGTNSYVPRVNSNLHIIENPDFIVYRGHSNGIMFKEDVSGPRALSSSEIGLTAGPNRQQLAAVLRDPHTTVWLNAVTNISYLTLDVLCAIPILDE